MCLYLGVHPSHIQIDPFIIKTFDYDDCVPFHYVYIKNEKELGMSHLPLTLSHDFDIKESKTTSNVTPAIKPTMIASVFCISSSLLSRFPP